MMKYLPNSDHLAKAYRSDCTNCQRQQAETGPLLALWFADKSRIGCEVANCHPTANEKVVKWEIQN